MGDSRKRKEMVRWDGSGVGTSGFLVRSKIRRARQPRAPSLSPDRAANCAETTEAYRTLDILSVFVDALVSGPEDSTITVVKWFWAVPVAL